MPKQFSKQRDIDVSLRLVVVTSIELKLVELNRALRGGITFKHARAPLHRSGHLLPPSAQATGQPGAEPGAQSLEVRLYPKLETLQIIYSLVTISLPPSSAWLED